jgi:hypothetical protein
MDRGNQASYDFARVPHVLLVGTDDMIDCRFEAERAMLESSKDHLVLIENS